MRVRRPGRPVLPTALAVAAVAVLHPSSAPAHGGSASGHHEPAGGSAERALRESEAEALGPTHAAEHAEQRAGLRAWAERPAKERAAIAARTRRAATRATASAGRADEVGRWSDARVALPTWAINAVVLPTGKVAYWGRGALGTGTNGYRANAAPFYTWDPQTGVSRRHDPPQETIDLDGDGQADDVAPAPIFCSGQSLLPSGELFVAGGNAFYPEYGSQSGGGHAEFGGYRGTYSFDPWTERWTRQPRMRRGRWYPSQQLLPDGRTVIASGYDERGAGDDNEDLELFTPGAQRGAVGTIRTAPRSARRTEGFYPHMQVLPGGKVAYVGQYRRDTRILDPGALPDGNAWTDGPYGRGNQRVGGSAALLPGTSTMLHLGGYGADWDEPGITTRSFDPATATAESTDLTSGEPAWRQGDEDAVPDLDRPRSYGQLVQLPDGGFAYVGGAAGFDRSKGLAGNNATAGQQALKSVALWKPGEPRWRTGPAQAKWRSYHSTAVLLPDGRVLSAGDDFWNFDDVPSQGPAPAGEPQDRGEIYEPAYLFDGDERAPRPAIDAGPSAVRWGAPFGVGVTEARDRPIVRATLVAPDAVTHAVNMNRVFAELPVDHADGGANLLAPPNANRAPPGWYMLFLWDSAGTPSEARWVQLRADAPDAPVLPGSAGEPGAGGPGGGGGGSGGGSNGGDGNDGGTPGGGSGGAGGGGGSEAGGGSGTGSTGGTGGAGPGSGAGGSANGAPGSGAPRPAPAVADRRGPRMAVAVRRVTRASTSLRIRVGADEPGRIALRVRAAGGRERTRTIRLTTRRLGTLLTIPLDRAGRRTLRTGRPLRVVVRTTAKDAGGNVARRTVVVRLRPTSR